MTSRISALDKDYKCQACGSYRRGKPSSGDIDILLSHVSFVSSKDTKRVNFDKEKQLVGLDSKPNPCLPNS